MIDLYEGQARLLGTIFKEKRRLPLETQVVGRSFKSSKLEVGRLNLSKQTFKHLIYFVVKPSNRRAILTGEGHTED